MNMYLACFSFVALCFSLAEAVTREELLKSIYEVNSEVKARENIAIGHASRDAFLRATTPIQKVCIATKMGPAYRELNLALNKQLVEDQNKYLTLTPEQLEELEETSLIQELYESNLAASTAQNYVDQINKC